MKDSDVGLDLGDIHLHEEDVIVHDVTEMDDFIITEDPLDPDNEEAWAVVITKGEYKDWVVRFPKIELAENSELEFTYEVVFIPDSFDGKDLVDVELANYFSSILVEVIETIHGTEGQIYLDKKTGEQIVV
jgi:hypothetical protein